MFVSDHGMTDTSHPEWIYIDDILGEGFKELEHVDGELHGQCNTQKALAKCPLRLAGNGSAFFTQRRYGVLSQRTAGGRCS